MAGVKMVEWNHDGVATAAAAKADDAGTPTVRAGPRTSWTWTRRAVIAAAVAAAFLAFYVLSKTFFLDHDTDAVEVSDPNLLTGGCFGFPDRPFGPDNYVKNLTLNVNNSSGIAPDFTLLDLDGTSHALKDFRGRPTLIQFGSWPVELLRNTPYCIESAALHSYGLECHCRSVLRGPTKDRT